MSLVRNGAIALFAGFALASCANPRVQKPAKDVPPEIGDDDDLVIGDDDDDDDDDDDIPLPTCTLDDVILVDFGGSEADTITPWGDWTTLLRHPDYTAFVSPDADPSHAGIATTPDTPDWDTAYFGVSGTTPIEFLRGHRVEATFYNATDAELRLQARISFSDIDEPSGADWDTPWNTMYAENVDNDDFVAPGSTLTLVYNITDEDNLVAPLALPTAGLHTSVNINLCPYNSWPGAFVLTELRLTCDADDTAPTAPGSLEATMVPASTGAGDTIVELSWDASEDPPGDNGTTTGVNRYLIYRDGDLYDSLSQDWVVYHGNRLIWQDIGAAPDSTYTYEITAIDAAVTGHYRIPDSDSMFGNESEPAEIVVDTPAFLGSDLIDPFADIEFIGAFRMPLVDPYANSDWGYADRGLAFDPNGNPGFDPATELPGSLFGVGHALAPQISEVSIPIPVISNLASDLPRATTLTPFSADIWPAVYNGDWVPPGGADANMGIGYHPGGNGVGPRLYYGIYNNYTSTAPNAHGSLSLDLDSSVGAWYLGGDLSSPDHVPPIFTDKFVFAAPQAWADQHTGGRSLIVGQGYQSGVGVPSHGPALYAIAPWETGALPGDQGVVSAQMLLRYGPDDNVAHWNTNWSLTLGYSGAAWLQAGQQQAVVVAISRPVGEQWYGGEDGTVTFTSDFDIPGTRTAVIRGPTATERESALYFYNPDDLAAVAAGTVDSWAPKPYFMLDFKDMLIGGSDDRFPGLGAIAFDAVNGYLYMIEANADDSLGVQPFDLRSLVYVWKVT